MLKSGGFYCLWSVCVSDIDLYVCARVCMHVCIYARSTYYYMVAFFRYKISDFLHGIDANIHWNTADSSAVTASSWITVLAW
jgi:hypothetical protein